MPSLLQNGITGIEWMRRPAPSHEVLEDLSLQQKKEEKHINY